MESIKLSELNPDIYIIHGSRNELGTVSLLLYKLYTNQKLPLNPRAIIDDKNYMIDIDLKKEDIIQGFRCWVCNQYLGESISNDCDRHPYSQNENYAPEYVYILKKQR